MDVKQSFNLVRFAKTLDGILCRETHAHLVWCEYRDVIIHKQGLRIDGGNFENL